MKRKVKTEMPRSCPVSDPPQQTLSVIASTGFWRFDQEKRQFAFGRIVDPPYECAFVRAEAYSGGGDALCRADQGVLDP